MATCFSNKLLTQGYVMEHFKSRHWESFMVDKGISFNNLKSHSPEYKIRLFGTIIMLYNGSLNRDLVTGLDPVTEFDLSIEYREVSFKICKEVACKQRTLTPTNVFFKDSHNVGTSLSKTYYVSWYWIPNIPVATVLLYWLFGTSVWRAIVVFPASVCACRKLSIVAISFKPE